jgi:hypothetical protein
MIPDHHKGHHGMKTSIVSPTVKLILAIAGGLLACGAIGVDLVNAYLYGMTTTGTMAALAVICAVAVVLLPMWLELGAPKILWYLWLACVVFTMNCAYQYYYVSAKQNSVAASTIHATYTTAEAEKTLALETLNRIKEHGDVGELGKLADSADASLKDAAANVAKYCKSRKVSGDCDDAQKAKTLANSNAMLAHTKVSDSKAWHEAKATLAEASATQKQGDAATHDVDIVTLIAALLLVQGLAALSGPATSLAAEALRERAIARRVSKTRKPATSTPELPTNGGNKVVSIAAAQWLAARTTRGAGLPGGDAKKNYERFAGHKISAKDFRAELVALLGADAIQPKNSGYIVKGYALKTVAATEKKSAVC